MNLAAQSDIRRKWRLVIQGTGNDCIPYLLELRRVRYFLDGSYVPVWLAPERNAAGAYGLPITVRPGPRHHYRLNTGTEPREQVMSECLNFRGMWPQEIYVYMREFQGAVRGYLHETFAAEMKHLERRRLEQIAEMMRRRLFREQEFVNRQLRNKQIIELSGEGKTPFGIAVGLNVKYRTVLEVIRDHKIAQVNA